MVGFGRFDVPPAAKTATSVVLVVVALALVAPFVVYAFPPVVGADHSYVVLTGSMRPAIDPGDVVIVQSVPAGAVAIGDVITFRTSGSDVPVTHRVVDVTEDANGGPAFATKGDANEDPDARVVPAGQVVGRVVFTIPYIGYVVEFVNSPTGFVALVLVPIGLLVLDTVWGIVRDGRDDPPDATGGTSFEGTDAAGDGLEAAAEPAPDDGFTVTKADLTMTSVALGALAAYSVFVGFTTRDALSVAVAVGATTSVLLAVGVRQFGFADEEPASASGTEASPAATDGGGEGAVGATAPAAGAGVPTAAARVIPTVDLPVQTDERYRVAVGSLADLGDIAAQTGHPVVRDGGDGAFLVVDRAAVYGFDPAAAPGDSSEEIGSSEEEGPGSPPGRDSRDGGDTVGGDGGDTTDRGVGDDGEETTDRGVGDDAVGVTNAEEDTR